MLAKPIIIYIVISKIDLILKAKIVVLSSSFLYIKAFYILIAL